MVGRGKMRGLARIAVACYLLQLLGSVVHFAAVDHGVDIAGQALHIDVGHPPHHDCDTHATQLQAEHTGHNHAGRCFLDTHLKDRGLEECSSFPPPRRLLPALDRSRPDDGAVSVDARSILLSLAPKHSPPSSRSTA
jgi:hypothetical protein